MSRYTGNVCTDETMSPSSRRADERQARADALTACAPSLATLTTPTQLQAFKANVDVFAHYILTGEWPA